MAENNEIYMRVTLRNDIYPQMKIPIMKAL